MSFIGRFTKIDFTFIVCCFYVLKLALTRFYTKKWYRFFFLQNQSKIIVSWKKRLHRTLNITFLSSTTLYMTANEPYTQCVRFFSFDGLFDVWFGIVIQNTLISSLGGGSMPRWLRCRLGFRELMG
jgi:hypothetical protein